MPHTFHPRKDKYYIPVRNPVLKTEEDVKVDTIYCSEPVSCTFFEHVVT